MRAMWTRSSRDSGGEFNHREKGGRTITTAARPAERNLRDKKDSGESGHATRVSQLCGESAAP